MTPQPKVETQPKISLSATVKNSKDQPISPKQNVPIQEKEHIQEKSPGRISNRLAMFEVKSKTVDRTVNTKPMGKLVSSFTSKLQALNKPEMTGNGTDETPVRLDNQHGGSVHRSPIMLSQINKDEPKEVKLIKIANKEEVTPKVSSTIEPIVTPITDTIQIDKAVNPSQSTDTNNETKNEIDSGNNTEPKLETCTINLTTPEPTIANIPASAGNSTQKSKLLQKLTSAKKMIRTNTKEPDALTKKQSEKIVNMAGFLGSIIAKQTKPEDEVNKILGQDTVERKKFFLQNDSDIQQIDESQQEEIVIPTMSNNKVHKDINEILQDRPVRKIKKKARQDFAA